MLTSISTSNKQLLDLTTLRRGVLHAWHRLDVVLPPLEVEQWVVVVVVVGLLVLEGLPPPQQPGMRLVVQRPWHPRQLLVLLAAQDPDDLRPHRNPKSLCPK